MSNRTRLDSLRVGERFKFDSLESSPTYIHRGFDARSRMQGYTKDLGPNSIRGDVWSLAEGARYVIPLDSPAPTHYCSYCRYYGGETRGTEEEIQQHVMSHPVPGEALPLEEG